MADQGLCSSCIHTVFTTGTVKLAMRQLRRGGPAHRLSMVASSAPQLSAAALCNSLESRERGSPWELPILWQYLLLSQLVLPSMIITASDLLGWRSTRELE